MRFNYILITLFLSLSVLGAGTFIKGPALIEGFTTTVSAAGTTTLTAASETKQIVTGSTTQTIVMPDATTLPLGRKFLVINKSSGTVTVNANGGGLLGTISGGAQAEVHLRVAGSAAGTWDLLSSSAGGGGTWGSITGTLSSQTDLNTALNLKAPLASPTFTGTITTPLVVSKAVVTNGSGALAASGTSATQVGYLSNLSQDVQTSLDSKTDEAVLTTKGDLYVATASATLARQAVGSNGQMLIADSTQTNGVRWAADPDGNLIPDGNAEFGVTNFVEGSYSAATRPAGTFTSSSGSGTFAITTSTSSPLFGSTSFLLTKSSGASRQGRAIERTITIDSGYRTKMLKTRIDYTIVSGTFVAGSNGSSPTDSSLIWYVGQYNGSTWSYTEPSTFKMFSNSTTNSDWVEGEFQVNSDTTQIKLIGFISESANSAWVVKAEVGFRLSTFLAGTNITAFQSYTPSNTQGFGSVTAVDLKWSQKADTLSIEGGFTSGTVTGSTAQLALPNGLVIGGTTGKRYHVGELIRAGGTRVTVFAIQGNNYLTFGGGASSQGDVVGSSLVGSSEVLLLSASEIPILGWSSSVQVSDGYDGRLIAGTYKTLSSTTITSGTALRFTTIVEDKTASYNTGTGATVIPSQGTYEFNIGGINAGAVTDVKMFIGASDMGVIGSLATGTGRQSIVIQHPFSAGDSVTFVPQTSGTASDTVGWMTFRKLQGPTTISATERVSFYAHTSANAATTSAPFLFTTITDNTHGAYSASTGKFTAPTRGFYMFRGNTYSSTVHEANCYLNNTQYSRGAAQKDSSTPANFTCSAPMNAGDTMEIRPSGSVTSSGDGTLNNFSGFLVK